MASAEGAKAAATDFETGSVSAAGGSRVRRGEEVVSSGDGGGRWRVLSWSSRAATAGAGAVVPHVGRGWVVVELRCVIHLLACGERRVKTQPDLCRTDNYGARVSFPLLRALSCHLSHQGWAKTQSWLF
jgi:hypothetical protein